MKKIGLIILILLTLNPISECRNAKIIMVEDKKSVNDQIGDSSEYIEVIDIVVKQEGIDAENKSSMDNNLEGIAQDILKLYWYFLTANIDETFINEGVRYAYYSETFTTIDDILSFLDKIIIKERALVLGDLLLEYGIIIEHNGRLARTHIEYEEPLNFEEISLTNILKYNNQNRVLCTFDVPNSSIGQIKLDLISFGNEDWRLFNLPEFEKIIVYEETNFYSDVEVNEKLSSKAAEELAYLALRRLCEFIYHPNNEYVKLYDTIYTYYFEDKDSIKKLRFYLEEVYSQELTALLFDYQLKSGLVKHDDRLAIINGATGIYYNWRDAKVIDMVDIEDGVEVIYLIENEEILGETKVNFIYELGRGWRVNSIPAY